ncbi:MAG: hypothetical protein ACRDRK_08395 [Pseudonocardia sp.]
MPGRLPGRGAALGGLLLGVAASVAANIAAAEPTVLGRVVAAWAPLAFALAFELLVLVLRDSTAQDRSAPADEAVDVGMVDEHGLSRLWETAPPTVDPDASRGREPRDDAPAPAGPTPTRKCTAAGSNSPCSRSR